MLMSKNVCVYITNSVSYSHSHSGLEGKIQLLNCNIIFKRNLNFVSLIYTIDFKNCYLVK